MRKVKVSGFNMAMSGHGVFLPPGEIPEFIVDPDGSMSSSSAIVESGTWQVCKEPPKVQKNATEDEDKDAAKRTGAVKAMFEHAWKGYVDCALGRDEVRPVDCTAEDWLHMGITVVDSLDTMLMMGLDSPLEQATEWIENHLPNPNPNPNWRPPNGSRTISHLISTETSVSLRPRYAS